MCPAAKYAFPSGGARGPRPTGHTRAGRAVRPYNAEQARNGTSGTPSPTKGQGDTRPGKDDAMDHEFYMQQALALAREAAAHGEVPVGCVIVRDGQIIASGRNRREEKQSAASHAEMEALAQANEVLHSWRLDDCDLYVTLEPCPMCAGAILNARIRRVFYGARDDVMGACGGVLNLYMEGFPRPPQLVGNICGDECRDVLQSFFQTIRSKSGENEIGTP